MFFVKLLLDKNKRYRFDFFNSETVGILGLFLAHDVGCYDSTYKEWAKADKFNCESKFGWTFGGNVTFLEEKEDGFIYLSSSLPLEKDAQLVEVKLTKKQLINILDDWEQKVCKLKPAQVTIKYENDEFIFEIK